MLNANQCAESEETDNEDSDADSDSEHESDDDSVFEDNKYLEGYRIGFFTEVDEDMLHEVGADLLYIPPCYEHRNFGNFLEWWNRATKRAVKDRLQLVVLIPSPCRMTVLEQWFLRIEEDEWCSNGEGLMRLRFTTCRKIDDAVFNGKQLMDDWGDVIEKGTTGPKRKRRMTHHDEIPRYTHYRWREKRRLLRSTQGDGTAVTSSSVDRPLRMSHQMRITSYFQRKNP
jgi:hypothetical protein